MYGSAMEPWNKRYTVFLFLPEGHSPRVKKWEHVSVSDFEDGILSFHTPFGQSVHISGTIVVEEEDQG